MRDTYAAILYNPEVSDDVKQEIEASIASARRQLIGTNTLLMFQDILGMSAINDAMRLGAKPLTVWSYIKKNAKLLSLGEGAEELTQNILQAEAQYAADEELNQKYQNGNLDGLNRNIKIEGLEYKEDETLASKSLLALSDPKRAQEFAQQDFLNFGERLLHHASKSDAWVEFMSGVVGGGPQFMITGLPRMRSAIKAQNAKIEEQNKYFDYINKVYGNFIGDNIASTADIQTMIDEIKKKYATTDEQGLQVPGSEGALSAIEEYALKRAVYEGVQRGYADGFSEQNVNSRKELKAMLSGGKISKDEYNARSKRLDIIDKTIRRAENLMTYVNGPDILQTEMRLAALDAAEKSIIAAQSVSTTMENRAPRVNLGGFFGTEQNAETEQAPADTTEKATEQKQTEEKPAEDEKKPAEKKAEQKKEKPAETVLDETTSSAAANELKQRIATASNIDELDHAITLVEQAASDPTSQLSEEEAQTLISYADKIAGEFVETSVENTNEDAPTTTTPTTPELPTVTPGGSQDVTNTIEERLNAISAARNKAMQDLKFLKSPSGEIISARYARIKRKMVKLADRINTTSNKYEVEGILAGVKDNIRILENEIKALEKQEKALKEDNKELSLIDRVHLNAKKNLLKNYINITNLGEVKKKDIDKQSKYTAERKKTKKEKKRGFLKRMADKVKKTPTTEDQTPEGFEDTQTPETTENTLPSADEVRKLPQEEQIELVKKHFPDHPGDELLKEMARTDTLIEMFFEETDLSDLADTAQNRSFDDTMAMMKEAVELIQEHKEEVENSLDTLMENRSERKITPPGEQTQDKKDSVKVDMSKVEALDTISAIAKVMAEKRNGTLPTLETMKKVFQLSGFDKPEHMQALDMYYAIMLGDENIRPVGRRTPQKKDADAKYKDVVQENRTWVMTDASLHFSGNSISWIDDSVKDFEEVKEDTPLVLKVLTDEEIAKKEQERGENATRFRVWIGTTNNSRAYTWAEYMKAYNEDNLQDAEGNKVSREAYKPVLMRPVEVRAKTSTGEKVIGHLRTSQYLLRERRGDLKETAEIKFKREQAMRDLVALRVKLFTNNNDFSKEFTAKVEGRSNNVKLNDDGSYIAGTALRKGDKVRAVGAVFAESDVVFTTLSHNSQSGIEDRLYTKMLSEGKTVVVPEYLKDEYARENYSGALVVLIPVEGTNYMLAEKLNTSKLTQTDAQAIFDIVTRLHEKPKNVGDSTVLKKLIQSNKNYVPKPKIIQEMIKSILYTTENLEDIESPETLKFDVKAENFDDYKDKLKNAKKGEKALAGKLTIRVKLGSEIHTIAYNMVATKDVHKTTKKEGIFFSYELASDQTKRDELHALLTEILAEDERSAIPYYNVDELRLHPKNQKEFLPEYAKKLFTAVENESGEIEYTYNKKDYVKEYIYKIGRTNVAPPATTSSGKKNFFTNTIITVALDDTRSEEVKKEVKKEPEVRKDAKEEEVKRQKVILAKQLKSLQEELNSMYNEFDELSEVYELFMSIKKGNTFSIINNKDLTDEQKALIKKYKGSKAYAKVAEEVKVKVKTLDNAITAKEKEGGALMARYKNLNSAKTENEVPEVMEARKRKRFNVLEELEELKELAKEAEETSDEIVEKQDEKKEAGLSEEELLKTLQEAIAQEAQEKEEDAKTDSEIEAEVESAKTEPKAKKPKYTQTTKNQPQERKLSRLERLLLKYKLKNLSNIDQNKLDEAMSVSEMMQFSEMVYSKFLDAFLGTGLEDIKPSVLKELYNVTAQNVADEIYTQIMNLKNEDTSKLSDRNKKKVEQLLNINRKILETLIEPTKENKENTELVRQLYYNGISKALNILGFKKLTEYSKASTNRKSDEDSNTNVERDADYDDTSKEAWMSRFSHIEKDPKDKVNSRVKAKLHTFHEYENVDGNIEPKKGLFGGDVYTNQTYIMLLNLFSKLDNNRLKDKIQALQIVASEVLAEPQKNANMYFVVDLLEALNPKSKAKNAFSTQELHQLNHAMNNQLFEGRGLSISASGNMFIKNYNFGSVYDRLIKNLTLQFKATAENEELVNTLEVITNKYAKSPKSKRITDKDIEKGNVTIFDISSGRTERKVKILSRALDDMEKELSPDQITSYLSSLSFHTKANLVKDLDSMVIAAQKILDTDSMSQEDKQTASEALNLVTRVMDYLAPVVSSDVLAILDAYRIPLDSNMANELFQMIETLTRVPAVNYEGTATGYSRSVGSVLVYLSKDINLALNSKASPRSKELSRETKSLVAHLVRSSTSMIDKTTIRIGTKMIGTFNDKIFAIQQFQRLKNPDGKYLAALDKDVFAANSSIKFVLQNIDRFKGIEAIQTLFDNPIRAGLLPTPFSNIDDVDDAFNYAFYGLGNYLVGSEMRHMDRIRGMVTINKGNVPYHLRARVNKFVTPTHSDKDRAFTFNSLDFGVTYTKDESGKLRISDEYLDFYIDEVILPELNIILNNPDVVNMFFATPGLNKYNILEKIETLRGKTGLITSIRNATFENEVDTETFKSLVDTFRQEANTQIEKSVEALTEHYKEIGLVVETREGLKWSDKVAEIKDFQALNMTPEELKAHRQQILLAENKGEIFESEKEAVSAYRKVLENVFEMNSMRIGPVSSDTVNDYVTDKFIEDYNKILDKYPQDGSILSEKEEAKFAKELKGLLSKLGFELNHPEWLNLKTADKMDAFLILEEGNEELIAQGITSKSKDNAYLTEKGKELFDKVMLTKEYFKDVDAKDAQNSVISPSRFFETMLNMEYSSHIASANYKMLISGDTHAAYKRSRANDGKVYGPGYDYQADVNSTFDNEGKRLAKQVTPFNPGEGEGTQINIIIKDEIEDSQEYNGKDGYKKVTGIETTDGQSWEDTETRLIYNVLEGKMSSQQARVAKKLWNGEITAQEAIFLVGKDNYKKIALTIDKPRTVSMVNKHLPGGLNYREQIYYKTGIGVLTENNTSTDKNNLNRRRLDLLKYYRKKYPGKQIRLYSETAAKLKPDVHVVDLRALEYDEKGELRSDIIESWGRVEHEVPNDDHGRQVETDYKEGKKNKDVGQLMNLILNAVTPETKVKLVGSKEEVNVFERWNYIINRTNEIRLKNIKDLVEGKISDTDLDSQLEQEGVEIKAGKTDKVIKKEDATRDQKLAALILDSFKKLRDDDITITEPLIEEWLAIDETSGEFKYKIIGSPYGLPFMDVIRKRIEKATVAKKRAGKQLALFSDNGWDIRNIPGITLFDNANISDDGHLKPHTVDQPAQILIPYDVRIDGKKIPMSTFLNSEGKIDTRKLPKEVFEAIGFRTPTQDYSMMSYVEVVGFLPEGMENTVVAPKEFVDLMGSDFDIDKLFMHQKYYKAIKRQAINKKTGKQYDRVIGIELITEEDAKESVRYEEMYLENQRLELMQSILNHEKILKGEVVQSLNGEDHLRPLAKKMDKIINQNSYISGEYSNLSSIYNQKKRNNAAGAAKTIGIMALGARISAILNREPIPFYIKNSETGKLTHKPLKLGEGVFSEFGGGKFNKEGFRRNEVWGPSSRFSEFDKRKNNFSAGISLGVDNENLQLLDKLGLINGADGVAANIMLAGFRLSTAVAMVNMPTIDGTMDSKDLFERLIQKYNKATNSKLKIADIKTEHFSLLTKGKDETVLVDELVALNERLRKHEGKLGYSEEELKKVEDLSTQDIIDIIALDKFINDLKRVHKDTVKPFNWVFNIDSKGFSREFSESFRRQKLLENIEYKPVLDRLQRVPELKGYLDSQDVYMSKLNTLFRLDENTDAVHRYLGDSDIHINAVYDISQALRREMYKKHTPNRYSLFGRLNTILRSVNPITKEFVETNDFLKRLDIRGDKLAFMKDEEVTAGDIYRALEALNVDEELSGVNLKTLHEDLIKYAITVGNLTYGNNFVKYIHPKYLKALDKLDNQDKIDHIKIAAYVAYKNIKSVNTISKKEEEAIIEQVKGLDDTEVTEAELNDDTEIKDTYEKNEKSRIKRIWKKAVNTKTGMEYVIKYIDANGEIQEINSETVETLFEDDTNNLRAKIIVPINDIEARNNRDNKPTEIDFDATVERLFNTSSMMPLKKFFSMLFGKRNIKTIFKDAGVSSFNFAENKVNLVGNSIPSVRNDLIHEGTHVGLQRAIFEWEKGTLGEMFGMNEKGEMLGEELDRIFNNMEDARKAVINKVIEYYHAGRKDKFAMDQIAFGDLANALALDFDPLFDSELVSMDEILAELPADLRDHLSSVTPNSLLGVSEGVELSTDMKYRAERLRQMYVKNMVSLYIMANDMYGFDKPGQVSKLYVTIGSGKAQKKVYVHNAEDDRSKLYALVKERFNEELMAVAKQNKENENTDNPQLTIVDVYKNLNDEIYQSMQDDTKARAVQQHLYGLSNLHEFSAQAYTMGTQATVVKTDMRDYNAMGSYESVLEGVPISNNYNTFIGKIMNKVFQLIKEFVYKLVGGDTSNKLFNDVMYAQVLVNNDIFLDVKAEEKIEYFDATLDIIENC